MYIRMKQRIQSAIHCIQEYTELHKFAQWFCLHSQLP